jgi:hypothetical protein
MSSTQQPEWKLVAQLGDVNPIEHGGYFVFEDLTGVYAPEGETVRRTFEDKFEIHRFILEPCTYINGVLSDNKYHPETPVWFADSIGAVSSWAGVVPVEFIAALTGDNIVDKARAWYDVGSYFGFFELDSYPLIMSREEVEARYAKAKYNL